MLLCVFSPAMAEELYIITTSDGSQIVAKEYRFTDEYVEYTTEEGLPGFIRKEDFVRIGNMIGVPPGQAEQQETVEDRKKRETLVWIVSAALLVVLYCIYLFYVTARKKKEGEDEVDIYYGRIEKEPATQGLLSFTYRGFLWRKRKWVIEARSAYQEDGILFVRGISADTGKRKTFRADRVVGPVTDLSSEHHAPMEHFFVSDREDE